VAGEHCIEPTAGPAIGVPDDDLLVLLSCEVEPFLYLGRDEVGRVVEPGRQVVDGE
jgi:hypothetical protein